VTNSVPTGGASALEQGTKATNIAKAIKAKCKHRIIKPPLKLSLNAYRAFGRKYTNPVCK